MTERIVLRKVIDRFARDPSATTHRRDDICFIEWNYRASENRIEDAGLAPELTDLNFPVGEKAGELRTGAGAAG